MCAMIMKCADLSHVTMLWEQHLEWSFRVAEEFYRQGDDEVRRGMPPTKMCERSWHGGWIKSQALFLEFVAKVGRWCY